MGKNGKYTYKGEVRRRNPKVESNHTKSQQRSKKRKLKYTHNGQLLYRSILRGFRKSTKTLLNRRKQIPSKIHYAGRQ